MSLPYIQAAYTGEKQNAKAFAASRGSGTDDNRRAEEDQTCPLCAVMGPRQIGCLYGDWCTCPARRAESGKSPNA